jgi:hypothetical protein
MIQAVACGHSLGAVHEVDFPGIVSGAINSQNTDGASHFDSTPDIFDNTGVLEYLNGTGLRGGPLVVGNDSVTNSDLRIFSSDGNATMESLAEPNSFRDKCFAIFERMIDTVSTKFLGGVFLMVSILQYYPNNSLLEIYSIFLSLGLLNLTANNLD